VVALHIDKYIREKGYDTKRCFSAYGH